VPFESVTELVFACIVSVSEITEALNCRAPNLVAFDKQDLPRRLHYSSSLRIPDVQLLMDETYEAQR